MTVINTPLIQMKTQVSRELNDSLELDTGDDRDGPRWPSMDGQGKYRQGRSLPAHALYICALT